VPPPKKPTALHLIEGTGRKDRMNPSEPKPKVEIPEAPKHLSKEARAEWDRITPLLEKQGLVTHLDRAALAMYCTAWGDHVKAQNMIRKHGTVEKTSNGNLIQSPYVSMSNHAMEIARKLLATFGMTPADRSKVSAAPKVPDAPGAKDKGRFFK